VRDAGVNVLAPLALMIFGFSTSFGSSESFPSALRAGSSLSWLSWRLWFRFALGRAALSRGRSEVTGVFRDWLSPHRALRVSALRLFAGFG
jgi:hypothetical protein